MGPAAPLSDTLKAEDVVAVVKYSEALTTRHNFLQAYLTLVFPAFFLVLQLLLLGGTCREVCRISCPIPWMKTGSAAVRTEVTVHHVTIVSKGAFSLYKEGAKVILPGVTQWMLFHDYLTCLGGPHTVEYYAAAAPCFFWLALLPPSSLITISKSTTAG